MRLKVLTLNPPFFPKYSRESRSPSVTKGGTTYYPMWLAYATGVLMKEGFDVRMVDAAGACKTKEEVTKIVRQMKPDYVVTYTSTGSVMNDAAFIKQVKDEGHDFHSIFVGPHASATPLETLRINDAMDSVARGEFDYIVRDLALELEKDRPDLSKVRGLSYKDALLGGKIKNNEPMDPIENLDEIPFVSKVYKRFLNIWDYFYSANLYPEVQIVTGRGCPYRCTFCHWPQTMTGRKFRTRSIENVMDEFDYIEKTFPGLGEIFLEDDTFTQDRKRTKEFCDLKNKRGNGLVWSCNARADVDLDTLKAMKTANCRLVCVGIESGVQEVLNNVKKGTTVEGIRKFFKNTKEANVLVHGCFMLGNKGDTKETIKETIKFAKELNPDTSQFFPLMVYPGTEAYEWAKEQGHLKTNDYAQWLNEEGGHNTIIDRPGLTHEELVQMCNDARTEYYFRPNYMATKAKQVLTMPMERRRILKAFQVFVKQLGK